MTDVTRILTAMERGDMQAVDQLLPIVYQELRLLAAQLLRREQPGQTLQATALVHDAYIRLVGPGNEGGWEGRRHFFGAAAEAMRRILVENARRKKRLKHGGGRKRLDIDLTAVRLSVDSPLDDLLTLDEALTKLAEIDKMKADLVKLRYFAGLSRRQAAEVLDISLATAKRYWTYARAWLYDEMHKGDTERSR